MEQEITRCCAEKLEKAEPSEEKANMPLMKLVVKTYEVKSYARRFEQAGQHVIRMLPL